MEFHEKELPESPENKVEMAELESDIQIDSSFNTHFTKLEEILRNKNNRENLLQQATENLNIYKQILVDQMKTVSMYQEKNQQISLKIKYENEWRDKIIKRMILTYDKLKIVTTSTNLVKNIITSTSGDQEKINQGKRQLMEQITFNKEKDDLKYNHLIHEDELLSKKIDKEKHISNDIQKQSETVINEINSKISQKKHTINELKEKINNLKLENQMMEKKNSFAKSEQNIISKEIDVVNLKLNTLEETIENDVKVSNEKISKLNDLIEINNNCINDIEKNTDVIKQELVDENEILDQINLKKNVLNGKISEYNSEFNSSNEEITKLKEVHESQNEEYKTKINGLQQDINETHEEIKEIENKNCALKEDNHLLVNQIISQESNNNQLETNKEKLKEDLKKEHLTYKENEMNFITMITRLKTILEEKPLNKNIENEIETLENKLEELKIEHETETTNYDNLYNEVSSKEINLNLEMDRLKETKQALKSEIGETKDKIKYVMEKMEKELQRVQEENTTKIKNLEEQTSIYKKETERVRDVNEEKRNQEFESLKQIEEHLKCKISEYQMKKENLDKELAMRIKELGRIRENREKLENEFIEEAEKEMIVDVPEIINQGSTKKSLNNSNKKVKFMNKEELPNLKLPERKYSSTSFSDSSICSLDSTSMLKKKLQKQKRPRQTLPSNFPDTQKSLDEIFNSLREEAAAETTIKKARPKKTRKTIF